jgi:hypothetical protein
MTRPEVSQHQILAEWCEARQMLNDAHLSDFTLPEAVDVLLGYRSNAINRGVVDLDLERSKRVHPSSRRRADLTVAPEVTP